MLKYLEHIPRKHCAHKVACFNLATYTVLLYMSSVDRKLWLNDPYLYRAWACAVMMHNWLTWVGVVDRRDWSKGATCSAYEPYQVIRSEHSSLFFTICDILTVVAARSYGYILRSGNFLWTTITDEQTNHFTPCACTWGNKNYELATNPSTWTTLESLTLDHWCFLGVAKRG